MGPPCVACPFRKAVPRVSYDDENGWAPFRNTSLDTYEALKLLIPGEAISRKAHDSRLIGILAALRESAKGAERRAPPPFGTAKPADGG